MYKTQLKINQYYSAQANAINSLSIFRSAQLAYRSCVV